MLQIENLLCQVVPILPESLFTAVDGLLDSMERQKIPDLVLYHHPSPLIS